MIEPNEIHKNDIIVWEHYDGDIRLSRVEYVGKKLMKLLSLNYSVNGKSHYVPQAIFKTPCILVIDVSSKYDSIEDFNFKYCEYMI